MLVLIVGGALRDIQKTAGKETSLVLGYIFVLRNGLLSHPKMEETT